ncbi:Coenzyme F420 hydrogenase/dehydrogenase, beta subunit C-terminal domain [Pontibacterium sp.]|uniref:Coenzyme F420 hydrogenase/dehydrogenase, beta subunit C-terminal domain n=1 Tax=Pontibacterium sp. TaxID=2036026 RepID=UPI003568C957
MKIIDVNNIVDSGLCTGCGLCASVTKGDAIKFGFSNGGYLRPTQVSALDSDESAIIAKACPGLGLSHEMGWTDKNYHPVWGKIEDLVTGWATDEDVRHKGSSGGALTTIAIYLLESKKVDAVLHISASDENPLENSVRVSRSRGEILNGAGSRYSPSAPLLGIADILDSDDRVAVIAKPCDIAALRHLARVDPKVDQHIPYMLSFFCAGLPSINGTYEVLKRMDVPRSDVLSFRYRGNGWPGYTTAETRGGRVEEMDYNTSWGTILNRFIQFRCKVCPDGIGEFADVVCADAWHCDENGYPDFSEEQGRSLIVSRTTKGLQLKSDAIESGYLEQDSFKLEHLDDMQPYQHRRKQLTVSRLLALKVFFRKTPEFRNFKLLVVSRSASPLDNLRSFAGTVIRVLKGKVTES